MHKDTDPQYPTGNGAGTGIDSAFCAGYGNLSEADEVSW